MFEKRPFGPGQGHNMPPSQFNVQEKQKQMGETLANLNVRKILKQMSLNPQKQQLFQAFFNHFGNEKNSP